MSVFKSTQKIYADIRSIRCDLTETYRKTSLLQFVVDDAVDCSVSPIHHIQDRGLVRSLRVGSYGDKHVFITGCDSGFGRELAIQLDRLGFHVFAGCLTEDGAKSLPEVCSSRLLTVSLDVTNDESIEAAFQVVKKSLPAEKGLWALVNNAGILGFIGPFEVTSKQAYHQVFNVNLFGPIEMTRRFLPLVRKSQGRIVNTASISGRLAFGLAPYTISKYGVEAMSDILRREVYRQGIKVSVVEPGGFRTQIASPGKIVEEVKEAFEQASQEVRDIYQSPSNASDVRAKMDSIGRFYSPSLQPVIDAYTHAITAKLPRTRYVVGKDAKFLFIPLSYLPDCLCDLILRLFFK